MIKHCKILLSFITFLILVLTNNLQAQNLKRELKEAANKYKSADFKMDVLMKMTYWDATKGTTISKGTVKRKGNNYYTNFEGQISLKNSKYKILVTENDENIIYMPLSKNDIASNESEIVPDTSLFNHKTTLVKADASGKLYEISKPSDGILKIQIKLSPNNNLIGLSYYYDKTEESPIKKVEINYENITFNPSFSQTEFSEATYFQIVNNKPILSSKYKKYSITNAINNY